MLGVTIASWLCGGHAENVACFGLQDEVKECPMPCKDFSSVEIKTFSKQQNGAFKFIMLKEACRGSIDLELQEIAYRSATLP